MDMALYKHSGYILQSEDEIFDDEYRAGRIATRAGIYRCSGCGREIISEQKNRCRLTIITITRKGKARYVGRWSCTPIIVQK